LHSGEKTSLEQLAILGHYFYQIQAFLDTDHKGNHRSVLASSLDKYMNLYRTDICDLEVQSMEPLSTISTIQLKLEKVYKINQYHFIFPEILDLIKTELNGIALMNLIHERLSKSGSPLIMDLYKEYF
jgi:hypothetical protein